MKQAESASEKRYPSQGQYLKYSINQIFTMAPSKEIDLAHMSIKSAFSFYLHSAWQEATRRCCSYVLSLLSVTVVVMASSVSQSIIDRAPIIFLKAAEGPATETDIEIYARGRYLRREDDDSPQYILSDQADKAWIIEGLNLTKVNEVLGEERSKQTSPRFENSVNITGLNTFNGCEGDFDISTKQHKLNSDEHKAQKYNASSFGCNLYMEADFLSIDTARERKIGLGREYPYEPLKVDECLISTKMANQLRVEVGDTILIQGDFYWYYSLVKEHYDYMKEGFGNYSQNKRTQQYSRLQSFSSKVFIPYKVKDLFTSSYGKFEDGQLGRTIITESKHLFKNLAYWSSLADSFIRYMHKADPHEYSDTIKINIPGRMDIYTDSNYDNIQFAITGYGSKIGRDLGVNPIHLYLPVLEELYELRFGQLILGIVLNMIIVILFLLSVILLYNLLLISVETKTYELGVLRVVGFNKIGVVFLILIQALSYVIPAIIAGILLAIPGLYIASTMLQSSIGVQISIFPTPNALLLGIGLGLLIPLLSSYVPIRSALSQQLSFALDLQRSKSQAVKIDVDVEGNSLPWGRIYFAVVSAMFGISIYFLLPLSLLSFDIQLLLAILFWILCGMLLGLVLLSFNFQYLFERFVVAVFLCCVNKSSKMMVLKNLAAHRIKNRRTALMFSLSIAFIIFISTAMAVQVENSSARTLQKYGTPMSVEISKFSNDRLPVMELEELIEGKLYEDIEEYAWITQPLDSFMESKGYDTVYLTHIGRVYQQSPHVVGVSPSLLKMGFNQFLNVETGNGGTGLDPVEELYTARGSQSCLVSTFYAEDLRLKVSKDDSVLLVVYNNTYSQQHELRVSTVLNTIPSLKMSSLQQGSRAQDVVVSLPTYMRLANHEINSFKKLPMQRLLLKFKPGANKDRVHTEFSTYLEQAKLDYDIWDFRDHQKSLEQSQSLITIIFTVLTIIVMILSYFSLSSSMSANLMEQVKEISVLRSIGNTKIRLFFIYCMEAFVLVLSSSFIGMIVGYIVGYTMALQQTLFTQLPMVFNFPYSMILAIIITSLILAFFSVLLPASRLLNKEISAIMRLV